MAEDIPFGSFAPAGQPPPAVDFNALIQRNPQLRDAVLSMMLGPMSDASPYPIAPGQQYAANSPSRSEIEKRSIRQLEDLRRKMGVQADTQGGKDTDAALKAIEEALRYAPK